MKNYKYRKQKLNCIETQFSQTVKITKPHSNQFEWGLFLKVCSTFQIASLPFLKLT